MRFSTVKLFCIQPLYLAILLFCCSTAVVQAKNYPLSEKAEISILTIGPGAELYDKFGHSAFRVKDVQSGLDIVYNYGVYDFETPNFYTKFAQGKLLYQLGVSYYEPFYENYVRQDRWVKEQVLNLSTAEKQAVFDFLELNAKPENRKYKYDFFYDNCATKIRDVLKQVLGNKVQYSETYITKPATFRELIQENLYANSWGSLGIDMALGAVIDRTATPWEHQFLPDYIFIAAESATIATDNATAPLVKDTQTLYKAEERKEVTSFWISPLFIFTLIGLLIAFITVKDYKNHTRTRSLDITIFIVTGFIGCILLFLWFGTDHTATVANYNVLWAFPLSLVVVFAVAKRNPKPWVRRYIFFLLLLLALLTIHWFTGIQVFAIGFIPLFVALAIRYGYLIYFLKEEPAELS